MAAAAMAGHAAVAAQESGGIGVRMPPTYVLRQGQVKDALKAVHAYDMCNVTVWIHSSTLGIEEKCFRGMVRVSRILVWWFTATQRSSRCAQPAHREAQSVRTRFGGSHHRVCHSQQG